jgi:glycosyltransferase involved in cell wall biosynthesis
MKFTCLLPVRDEADIIGQCLQQLVTWADEILVFDTGSVDDTWEIVTDLAAREKRIVPLRKDPVFFSENRLRGWLFHQARQRLRDGDWFVRVDADEFHHIPPPEFVKTRIRPHETVVYHQYYNFALRASEVADWEAGKETLADRSRPIEERRQWFQTSVYAEPRLCKYRSTMKWPSTVAYPFNAGFLAVERIPIRHYPHRDPIQLERRCRLRYVMMNDAENRRHWRRPDGHRWSQKEWRNFITPNEAPDLCHWIPGTPLPEVHQTNHLARRRVRIAQRLLHALALPILDRCRQGMHDSDYPQRIPPELVQILKEELSES